MLLAQKAYSEGALSLCFYGAGLIDDVYSAPDGQREQAQLILDLLTPIFKAWPSEYGPKANDLAIQVLGGAGYTREYEVEQCWRDNRLNPIHEGTNGIQSLDLLGRKVWMHNSQGLQLLAKNIMADIKTSDDSFSVLAKALQNSLNRISNVTALIGKTMQEKGPDFALANSHAYLHLMGHTVVAWLWLKQANLAKQKLEQSENQEQKDFYYGKIQAAKYFYNWELPLTDRDYQVLTELDDVCFEMKQEWF